MTDYSAYCVTQSSILLFSDNKPLKIRGTATDGYPIKCKDFNNTLFYSDDLRHDKMLVLMIYQFLYSTNSKFIKRYI